MVNYMESLVNMTLENLEYSNFFISFYHEFKIIGPRLVPGLTQFNCVALNSENLRLWLNCQFSDTPKHAP